MSLYGISRKVFISFHQKDRGEVDDFIKRWANREGVFIPKALGASDNDDFVNSTNPEYVMSRIREKYLGDSTVSIILIGKCTHSRRYMDWEIKTSLRQGDYTPNGLIGILLPSCGTSAHLPQRFKDNWEREESSCYARYRAYPTAASQLADWIEDAYYARTTRAHLIQNTSDMMKYNSKCLMCGVTH
ncbi:MAG: TIR domain-containing protein [Nitrospirae bacterium]|nr:TIR domain-containing protein [Nitrospirota bacterium]